MIFTQFIKDVLKQFGENIQLGLPGVIDKFDKSTMRADVKFYLQTEDKDSNAVDYPIVANIPVQFLNAGGFYIRPDYQVGDKVWISFSTFDISEGLDENIRPESENIFNLHNACVSGGIASNKFAPPSEFSESGLLIGHEDGNAYAVFANDSITAKFGSKQIKMDSSGLSVGGATKQVVTWTELNTVLQTFIGLLNTALGTKLNGSGSPGTFTLDISSAKSILIQQG